MTEIDRRTGSAMAKKNPPSLVHKKDLIFHTYDLFPIAQTRLFVQACSNKESDSAEINRRRELLLLDDLTGFAIASRRLVELIGLKSFANRCKIPMVYLDRNEEPYQVMKFKDVTIGFDTLMNRLIHASIIEHIHNMLDFVLFVEQPKKEIREKIFWNRILKKNYTHEPMEQLLFVSTDDVNPVFFSIGDMVQQSIVVADKIVDVCNSNKIFLELDMRGAD
jgi:hypothetical protein